MEPPVKMPQKNDKNATNETELEDLDLLALLELEVPSHDLLPTMVGNDDDSDSADTSVDPSKNESSKVIFKKFIEKHGSKAKDVEAMDDELLLSDSLKPQTEDALEEDDGKLPSNEQFIHSVSVQGMDYVESDSEFEAAMKTRPNDSKWTNLIWAYEEGDVLDEKKKSEVNQLGAEVDVELPNDFTVVNFKKTMEEWEEKPEWVEKLIPILDIMKSKKAWIAMSDIMRMIVLYYTGGLYLDLKIQLDTETVFFDSSPQVKMNQLLLAKGNENWALIARSGCELISEIMEETTSRLEKVEEEIGNMPINYSKEDLTGKAVYSQEHVNLHENYGAWNSIDKRRSDQSNDNVGAIPDKTVENPRSVNSWAHPKYYNTSENDETHLTGGPKVVEDKTPFAGLVDEVLKDIELDVKIIETIKGIKDKEEVLKELASNLGKAICLHESKINTYTIFTPDKETEERVFNNELTFQDRLEILNIEDGKIKIREHPKGQFTKI